GTAGPAGSYRAMPRLHGKTRPLERPASQAIVPACTAPEMKRRQGRPQQCQAQAPRQNEAAVGACLAGDRVACTAPEMNRRQGRLLQCLRPVTRGLQEDVETLADRAVDG